MKKAYVVAEIKITNPEGFEEYKALSGPSVQQYGGRYIVRGGARQQLEGEDEQHNNSVRTTVIEFPSMEQARTWYESPEYQRAMAIRQAHAVSRFFMVEGV